MPKIKPQCIYLAIGIMALIVIVLEISTGGVTEKDIAASLLALFGTFIGATFAFRLNEDKEEKKEIAARKAALNRALFVLIRQRNAIQSIKNFLNGYENSFERAFILPAMKPPSYEDLVHNFTDLEFLLESENPNILFALTVEQERFHQAMESLRIRNEFYVNAVQPAIAAKKLNHTSVTHEQAETQLGELIYGTAMHGAEELYFHIYESEKSLAEMNNALLALARSIYPGAKFLVYVERT